MGPPLDSFDSLCQQFFLTASDGAATDSLDSRSDEETALSLITQAQVYELPASYAFPAPKAEGVSNPPDSQDRRCYRIHLETVQDSERRHRVRSILLQAIDRSVLLELPFDRNLTGYTSKSRTETTNAPLESPVVLDMDGVSASEEATGTTGTHDESQQTMLLLPTSEWIRMSARVRFWRAESHRIKTAQREVVLDNLLVERWRSTSSTGAMTLPPPPSANPALVSIPSSPISSEASSPTSPRSPTIPPVTVTTAAGTSHLQSSLFRQPFQEHQLDSLVQFMTQFGEEPSTSSILRGLLDLIRRQLTEPKVLSWTFDRANLTEQKPEATVAFLDLLARLGLELVVLNDEQTEPGKNVNSASASTTSEATTAGTTATAASHSKASSSTDLTWTLGIKADDRRLEYWIHHVQQATLPVVKVDNQSLLPSTASFDHNNSSASITSPSLSKKSLVQDQQQNPIPLATRKRFLHDRNTVAAGTIQFLTTAATTTIDTTPTATTSTGTPIEQTQSSKFVVRDRSYVLPTSSYAMSATSPAGLTERVKKDVIHLARWASTCGGRLDWIWAWLFASFQRSRHGSAAAANRRPRPNDENV
ncbi:hypothetical protein B0O80DRAFT_272714 [Mortierella sp. GBAus27b]|nr:hypothetical protein BGX31_009499 [Mortierella sp. GBA43]KAI8358011.1 hypothetical protein B0O80DRAFT_272714 [Mortierella sp. GBAus27b]